MKSSSDDRTENRYRRCKGMQITPDEREFIKAIAEMIDARFHNPHFVNIGVAWGASMHCLRAGSEKAELVGVDVDFRKHTIWAREALRAEFIQGDSGIVGKTYGHDIHLLFIDGCHYYGTVKADIQAWVPWVCNGGVVIFHDYNPSLANQERYFDQVGVKAAVDELMRGIWSGIESPGSLATFEKRLKG